MLCSFCRKQIFYIMCQMYFLYEKLFCFFTKYLIGRCLRLYWTNHINSVQVLFRIWNLFFVLLLLLSQQCFNYSNEYPSSGLQSVRKDGELRISWDVWYISHFYSQSSAVRDILFFFFTDSAYDEEDRLDHLNDARNDNSF